MENNKKNYVVIICLIIIALVSLLSLLIKKSDVISIQNNKEEYFHNYKVNEIQNVYVSLAEISNIYLSDLINLTVNNPRELYDILDIETKEKYPNYDDYLHMIERLKTRDFLNSVVVKYSDGVINNKNAIYVIDKANNNFVFIEDSINNYKVRIN